MHAGGVMDVWQTKDLWEGVFGSVAMIGLTGEFSEVWQIKGLAEERWNITRSRNCFGDANRAFEGRDVEEEAGKETRLKESL